LGFSRPLAGLQFGCVEVRMLDNVSIYYPDLFNQVLQNKITLKAACQWINRYGDGDDIDASCTDEVTEFFSFMVSKLRHVKIYIDTGNGIEEPEYNVCIHVSQVFQFIQAILAGENACDKEYMIFLDGVPYDWSFDNE